MACEFTHEVAAGNPDRQADALQRVGASTAYAAFVPSTGITSVDPANTIHFDAAALRMYGQRYFTNLNQAIERR